MISQAPSLCQLKGKAFPLSGLFPHLKMRELPGLVPRDPLGLASCEHGRDPPTVMGAGQIPEHHLVPTSLSPILSFAQLRTDSELKGDAAAQHPHPCPAQGSH